MNRKYKIYSKGREIATGTANRWQVAEGRRMGYNIINYIGKV